MQTSSGPSLSGGICASSVTPFKANGILKAGATREQILEAAGVAVMMRGGPVFVHMPAVLKALDQLQAASPAT